MRTLLIGTLALLTLSGCVTSSVHMLTEETKIYEAEGCRVEVFASQAIAQAAGPVDEVCRVEGSSMFSLNHGVDTAVRRSAMKVCECGAAKAYIETAYRHEGPSKATLVGFK